MISIGPYVVVREIPTRHSSETSGEASAGRTYRATDRLTGIPVLLHSQPTMNIAGVPSVPHSPILLPFTDIVVNAGEAYLVTELPANAVAAREPVQAARGALQALAVLHAHGLAHGHLNPAQLWSVDGPVRLAGGGRHVLEGQYTVARDLRDLALTLEELGGLPPVLSLLRTEPERLNAREALQLLQSGQLHAPQAATPAASRGVRFSTAAVVGREIPSLPNPDPLSLTDLSAPLPQGSAYWQGAVVTTTETSNSNTDASGVNQPHLPFKLDVNQWDTPDFLAEAVTEETQSGAGRSGPGIAPAHTVSLGWQDVSRPLEQAPAPAVTTTPDLTPPPPQENQFTRQGRRAAAAANQALTRLRADGQRLRQLQEIRRNEVAAQLGEHGAEAVTQRAALAEGEQHLPEVQEHETPQERRRRETAAREQEHELSRLLGQQRGEVARPAAVPSAGSAGTPGEENDPSPPVPARQLKGVKLRWDDQTKSWQRTDRLPTPGTAPGPSARIPLWVWPALLVGTLLIGLLVNRARTSPTALPAATCCNVNFTVQGGAETAEISILNTTSKESWTAGQTIGTAPGELHLPGEGTYKLNVAASGFTPAILEVTVPTTAPVTIELVK